MYKYTICFIRKGDKVLMLNREKPSWMGSWNGVGGKIEIAETPENAIRREIEEETGLLLSTVLYKGVVTWILDGTYHDGMYVFIADIPADYIYNTPVKMSEGILDWKTLKWLTHLENTGVAANVPYFLNRLFQDKENYEHRCYFENNRLLDVEIHPIRDKDVDAHYAIKKI